MSEDINQKNKQNVLKSELSFGRVKLKDKAIFAKNLAIMLKSGLTITESLDILEDQASGKFKKVIQSIIQSVVSGNSVSLSLSKFPKIFSSFFINTVRAGEASGNLENNLSNVAKQLTKDRELIGKIKSAMFYPLIVLALSLVIGLGLAFSVLPKITPIFMGLKIDLPITTRALIWFSNFVEEYGLILLAVLIIFFFLFVWLVSRKFAKPLIHWLFLHLPVINKLSRNKNLTLFSRTMGTLLKSGLTVDEALRITENTVGNYYYKEGLIRMRIQISQGAKLSDCLEKYSEYFPKLTIGLIRVGEKSGNLEEELFNLANIYEAEVDNAAKTLSTAVEPILLIIIGVVVGGLALSIITPIYKITGNVYR